MSVLPFKLPDILPVFPLPGVILLPHARLPLNIFEPRYLSMIEDVLGRGRMIGIIQPQDEITPDGAAPLYRIGCAGRITTFNETEDGRYLIGLTGLCRFEVAEEMPSEKSYRRVRPDWGSFQSDLDAAEDIDIDRKKLADILQTYFRLQNIAADWSVVENTPDDMLISSLVMVCPLAPNEKQALLEAPDLNSRANMLMALLEMASLPGEAEVAARH